MDRILRILIMEDCVTNDDFIDELREAKIPYISVRVIKKKDFMRALQDFSPDMILSDNDLSEYDTALARLKQRLEIMTFPLSSRRYWRRWDDKDAYQWDEIERVGR